MKKRVWDYFGTFCMAVIGMKMEVSMYKVRMAFLIPVVTLVCFSCTSQTLNQPIVFSLGGVMSPVVGVVVGDKVQFYSSEGDAWATDPEADLALPKGSKGVFSLGGVMSPVVGVVVGDKVQFYSSEGDAWATDPEADLALPKGSKGVFSLSGVMSPIVGVVVGDKVQFYSSEGDAWATDPEADLALPKG